MEIYFHIIIILIIFYKSNEKTLEEKMKNCILYLSKENSIYNETLKELIHLNDYYKDNDKLRIEETFKIYRKFNSIREPGYLPLSYIEDESFLSDLNYQKGIIEITDLTPVGYLMNNIKLDKSLFNSIYLWRGDITRLKIDAIVNAANNRLLGCWQPLHNCIDNVIFSYAGVQLRNEMYELMKKRGQYEEIGKARISKGYYLPSEYIIHTVGPSVNGPLTEKHKKLLGNSYKSVLELAKEKNIKTLAFCCISTGVFNFPNEEAANIAIKTVINFLKDNMDMKVIFCVYKEIDEKIYNIKIKEKMKEMLNMSSDDL